MRPLSWRLQGRGSSSCRQTEGLETCRAGRRLHPENHPQLAQRIRHTTAALVLAVAALAAGTPQAALAADYHAAIKDCADDGVLQGRYTRHTLRQARRHLPDSLREYSDCDTLLARAIAAASRPGSGGTGGGSPTPPVGNPALTTGSGAIASNAGEKTALENQAKKSTNDVAPTGISVGGRTLKPGTAGLSSGAVRASPNDLPTPLVAALIALVVMGLLAGRHLWRHARPETRSVALRILRR